VDKWIDDLVGTFTDPIIVMPGGWGENLPDWIKKRITLERMVEEHKAISGAPATASDAEVVAYLYTASLTAPMPYDFTQIYLYLAKRLMERESGIDQPALRDVGPERLSSDQERELARLRRWIYETRLKARAAKRRGERLPEQTRKDIDRIARRKEREAQERTPVPAPPVLPRERVEIKEKPHTYQVRTPWMPEGVQMWQVPLAQFLSWQQGRYPDAQATEIYHWRMDYHRRAVGRALRAGKPVPPEVQQDYPGLVQHPERGTNPTKEVKMAKSSNMKLFGGIAHSGCAAFNRDNSPQHRAYSFLSPFWL
jgi:hypothetical protein